MQSISNIGCLKVLVWLGGGILVHTITSTLGQVQVWLGCNIKIITLQSWYVQIKTNVCHINKSQPVSTHKFFVPQVCTPGKHIECSLSHDLVPDYLTQYLTQYLTKYRHKTYSVSVHINASKEVIPLKVLLLRVMI